MVAPYTFKQSLCRDVRLKCMPLSTVHKQTSGANTRGFRQVECPPIPVPPGARGARRPGPPIMPSTFCHTCVGSELQTRFSCEKECSLTMQPFSWSAACPGCPRMTCTSGPRRWPRCHRPPP